MSDILAIHLELSLVNSPAHVRKIGVVIAAPAVGDLFSCDSWWGYVKSRRWELRKDGDGFDVRVWLQRDPP